FAFPQVELRRLTKALLVIFCIALVQAIGWIDHFTKEDISIYVFYSIPIFLASWYVGRTAGLFISIECALTWLAVDLLDDPYIDHPILFGNAVIRFVFFMVISFILNSLKETLKREHLNRRAFIELGKMELARARRYNHQISVAFIDADDFK